MNVFLRIDNNIVAFLLLGAVYLLAHKGMDRKDRLNRKYLSTSLVILVEIAVETVTCVINGRPEPWLVPVSAALHVCLFATAPVLTYLWFRFVCDWVLSEDSLPWGKSQLLLIPIFANAVIAALSPFTGFIFYFDAAHLYHRGAWFVASSAITYSYMLLCMALILWRKRKVMRQEFLPIFIVCLFPTLGGLAQSVFYGALLMWSSCAFTLVVVYIFLQKRMIHLDSLTGAWTRGSFDFYLAQKAGQKNESFGVILADVDNLKRINDEYGHCEGDLAIRAAVRIIRDALRNADVLARTGGDEFVVVSDCGSAAALSQMVERIRESFARHNGRAGAAYRLECSFGAAMFDGSYNSIEQFMHHVDTMMYSSKKDKKSSSKLSQEPTAQP
jgi:diguanylate cyclase (GGDEF)-like protein